MTNIDRQRAVSKIEARTIEPIRLFRDRGPGKYQKPPPRRPSRMDAGDVPSKAAALRLGIDVADFAAALPSLIARGFPSPDPDTGNFDIEAIDAWRRARYPHLFRSADMGPRDAASAVSERIERMRRASLG